MGRLGIIIFARSSSKRLPNKVLKKICTIPLLKLIVSRVKKSSLKYQIIINTSSHKSDDKIIKFCKNENIKYFRGDLENVFDRTIKCCKKFKLKAFVRINADRPYLDYKLIDKMVHILKKKKFDIVTNQFPKTVPAGLACEVAISKVFFDLEKSKISKNEQEHIFNFFYKNSKNYRIFNFKDKFLSKIKNKKFSIDTESDIKKVNILCKKIGTNNMINFKTKRILKILENL